MSLAIAVGFGFGDGAEAAVADLAALAVAAGDVGEPGVGVASFADVGLAGLAARGHGGPPSSMIEMGVTGPGRPGWLATSFARRGGGGKLERPQRSEDERACGR